MSTALVVVHPFADYAKGARITDAKTVRQLLKDQSHRVLRIDMPDDSAAAVSEEHA